MPPKGWKPKPCYKCGGPKGPGKGRKFCDNCTQCCEEHTSYVRECAACQTAWRASKGVGYGYTDDRAKYMRMRKYGITSEEHDRVMAPGMCAVCGSTEKLCIDHDHSTGKVRGLLCNDCNLSLGYSHDSVDTLRKLIEYLEASRGDKY